MGRAGGIRSRGMFQRLLQHPGETTGRYLCKWPLHNRWVVPDDGDDHTVADVRTSPRTSRAIRTGSHPFFDSTEPREPLLFENRRQAVGHKSNTTRVNIKSREKSGKPILRIGDLDPPVANCGSVPFQ